MKLYIMRHGETKWNAMRRLQGRADVSLNENGIELAKVTKDAMKDIPLDLVISSPLKRAIETANIVTEGRKIPILLDSRLQEISFGVWEGLSCHKDNYELPDEEFLKFFEDPYQYDPPMGGETVKAVLIRTKAFYEEIIHNPKYQDKNILISTHGCTTRALLHNIYDNHDNFWQGSVPPNCSVNIIQVEKGISTFLEQDKIYYDPSRIIHYTK